MLTRPLLGTLMQCSLSRPSQLPVQPPVLTLQSSIPSPSVIPGLHFRLDKACYGPASDDDGFNQIFLPAPLETRDHLEPGPIGRN